MAKQLSLEQLTTCGMDTSTAKSVLVQINQWLVSLPASECWQQLTHHILKPEHSFALHQLLYEITFSDWEFGQGSPPVWYPSDFQINTTHIAEFMQELQLASYLEFHGWSVQHRAEFWDRMIQRLGIQFHQKPTQIFDLTQGVEFPQWLLGAQLNIVESCFQEPLDAPAIIHQRQGGKLLTWSYDELLKLTNRVANGLVEAGFQTGDPIAIALPMTATSVAIYLGIIKAGCVLVSIADSFAPKEIAQRLRLSDAKAIFTQDVIFRGNKELSLYTKVMAADAPPAIVLSNASTSCCELRLEDLSWETFLSNEDQFNAVFADPTAAINILFSSGTTGIPKAIPWTQTTPIKCASDGYLHHDIHPGDVVAWPTNLGWMMGPWLIYASLINQATLAIYEDVPTGRDFGKFIQNAHVTMLGVIPSLVRMWKMTDCMHGLNWSHIKAFSSTGECSNPQDMLFLMALAGYKPIIEYCGGTEIGGGYITGTLIQPCAPATFTTPALGLDVAILDDDGHFANKGEAFIIPPSLGLSTELLNQDHHQVYFAHSFSLNPHLPLRRHGDNLERLPNGTYRAHGRVDDTMNLGGIKVSAVEVEQVLNAEIGIHETAAIALFPPQGGPSQLVLYVVLEPGVQLDRDTLRFTLQTSICENLNPLFKIHDVVIVESLPRTASNKIMHRVLRDQYQAHVYSSQSNQSLGVRIPDQPQKEIADLKLEDYDISPECGFLPFESPSQVQLPEVCKPLEQIATQLSKWLIMGQVRQVIEQLPKVEIEQMSLYGQQWRRLMLLYSFLTHAYVWDKTPAAQVLPQNLAVPFYQISQQLHRPPVLSYASYALDNWIRIDKSQAIEISNIKIAQNFLGGLDEDWFILIHIDIEARAAPALAAIPLLLQGIDREHLSMVGEALEAIKGAWININKTMSRMPEACDPYIYYRRVRPYIHGWKNNPALPDGLIYSGVNAYQDKPQKFRGETGAQSTIVPTMDALFNIAHHPDPLRAYLIEMRDYMPPKHRAFVEVVEQYSTLRNFVKHHLVDAPQLKELYNTCLSLIEMFRTQHLEFASRYIHLQTAQISNATHIGTGGTPFMEYLKKHRDETNEYLLK